MLLARPDPRPARARRRRRPDGPGLDVDVTVDRPRLARRAPRQPVLLRPRRARRRPRPRRRRGRARRGRGARRPPRSTSTCPCLVVPDTRPAMAAAGRAVQRRPGVVDDGGRHHRHQRQDHDHLPAARHLRGGRAARPRCSARCRAPAPRPRRPSCRPGWPACATGACEVVAMEVSSHALALHRVDGTRFAVGRVHQPEPRPPRLPRDDGGVLRGQGPAVRARASPTGPWSTSTAPTAASCSTRPRSRPPASRSTTSTDLVVGASGSRFTWRGQPVDVRPRRPLQRGQRPGRGRGGRGRRASTRRRSPPG